MENINYTICIDRKPITKKLYIRKSVVEYTRENPNYAKKLEQKIDTWLKDMGINGWKTNVVNTEIIIICTSKEAEKNFAKLDVSDKDPHYIISIQEESIDFIIKKF